MRSSPLLMALSAAVVVMAQDGSVSGPTSSKDAAGYSCDPNKCQLPNCHCASTDPPNGLSPSDVPQFIVFTADDAIQSYTIDAVNQFLAQRKNPNGCQPKMTYYTSLGYTNYTLVTDWYVAGNEIADHTMTHVGDPGEDEINGNLIALNELAGIPLSSLKGFRAPFLNYSVDMLKRLAKAGFTYDSSATSSIPVTDPGTDAYWPYTLDNGLANDCLAVPNACKGQPQINGFWEFPMYALFDKRGPEGIHLMDPWLDTANGASVVDDSATLEYLKSTFTDHYNGKRQPFGLYTHPIHVAANYPGVPSPTSTIKMINQFLDWAQGQKDVWIISNDQLLQWMKNPTKISDLNNFDGLKCTTPQVDAKICNGMPSNEAGLLAHCAFSDFPFYTCYGCPSTPPTPGQPSPPQASDQPARHRISQNCSTPFWDPIDGKCVCTSSSCAFQDNSRPIGSVTNLTGSDGSQSGSSAATSSSFADFNSLAVSHQIPAGFIAAAVIGALGAFVGGWSVVGA
jgi:hypothetical protein